MAEGSIMKTFTKWIVLFLLLDLVSCTPRMTRNLWNGVYSQSRTVKEWDDKSVGYYNGESQEKKQQRRSNTKFCIDLSNKIYPYVEFGTDAADKKISLFDSCMKERGTPVY